MDYINVYVSVNGLNNALNRAFAEADIPKEMADILYQKFVEELNRELDDGQVIIE